VMVLDNEGQSPISGTHVNGIRPRPNPARAFDTRARESIMSAMRAVVLSVAFALSQMSCLPRRVDVRLTAPSSYAEFIVKGVGTLTSPMPVYSEMVKSAGVGGECRITMQFGQHGHVDSVWVIQNSGNSVLDERAVRADKGCRFIPMRGAYVSHPLRADVLYRFAITGTESVSSGEAGRVVRTFGDASVVEARLYTCESSPR
jgi:TonB family protein